jgi:AcrR family transcriptional regulator
MTTAPVAARRGRPPNPEVRDRILSTALELFAERGYDATSVNEVVLNAGVTKGALYHYFAAKHDLLYEIYRDLLTEQLAGLERILAREAPAADTLRDIIYDLVITTIDNVRAVSVFSRDVARLDRERWHELQTDWRRYQDAVRKLIRDAQRAGAFTGTSSPEVISWAIFGFTTSLPTWYRPSGSKSAADIADELATVVLRGVLPAPTVTEGTFTS